MRRYHKHTASKTWKVCKECLENSKYLAINVCQTLEQNYSDLSVVFSGKSGFHVHVYDFNVHDWTKYNEKNPIKSHEVSRFKLTKTLNLDVECFDRYHFIVSSDPMRIISVPESLNAENGLICKYIGDRKDLERKSINQIILEAVPFGSLYGYPEPLFFRGREINA